jgi:hypothetical protein
MTVQGDEPVRAEVQASLTGLPARAAAAGPGAGGVPAARRPPRSRSNPQGQGCADCGHPCPSNGSIIPRPGSNYAVRPPCFQETLLVPISLNIWKLFDFAH